MSSGWVLVLLIPAMTEAIVLGGVLETWNPDRLFGPSIDRLSQKAERADGSRGPSIRRKLAMRERGLAGARRQHDFFRRWLPLTTVVVSGFYVVLGGVWLYHL